jgi:hypothetical protein
MEIMMKLTQLLQAGSLPAMLNSYHRELHARWSFPPLTGMKPLHRLANVVGLPSAEPLLALVDEAAALTHSTSVNLSQGGQSQLLHVYFEAEDDTLRVMCDGDDNLLIVTVNPTDLGPACVRMDEPYAARVYFGAYALTLAWEGNAIEAALFEKTDGGKPFVACDKVSVGQHVMEVDRQSVIAPHASQPSAPVAVAIRKLDKLNGWIEPSRTAALATLRQEVLEDALSVCTAKEVLGEIPGLSCELDIDALGAVEAEQCLQAQIEQLDIGMLNALYVFMHEDAEMKILD